MTQTIDLKPGSVSFADWRLIARNGTFRLHDSARSTVLAGAEAIERILAKGAPIYGINTGFGKLANVRIQPGDIAALQRNIVISHSVGVGTITPINVVRLIMALKMSSLARGASGVRLETLKLLEQMCERDVIPVMPAQGSVGASGDLAPLAHLAATMIGIGDAFYRGERMAAARAFQLARLEPIVLAPKEGLALLNGTQFSTAHALSSLFTVERIFQTALISGALSTEAAKGSDTPFDPRIHILRGHHGQIDVAKALRDLMAGSAIRASHLTDDDRVQDPYCLRCQPQVMGAVLGLLRQTADTLLTEANGVSDNPLIFADTDEALSGGNFHAEAVAFAADIIALAICEIGSLAERRIAMLIDPSLSRLPAFLTSLPGLNSGLMVTQIAAAALVSENKQQAYPASVDSIPTSANQEDHVSMAAHGARRLTPMADNVTNILAIELISAAQGCDFHTPLKSSVALERVRSLVRSKCKALKEDRFLAPDIAAVKELVDQGAFVETCGLPLPTLDTG